MVAFSRLLLLRFSSVLVNSVADINMQVVHYFYVYTLLAAVAARRPIRNIQGLLEAGVVMLT